jgi:hypothetical protein
MSFLLFCAYTQATFDLVCAGAPLFIFTPFEGQMICDRAGNSIQVKPFTPFEGQIAWQCETNMHTLPKSDVWLLPSYQTFISQPTLG